MTNPQPKSTKPEPPVRRTREVPEEQLQWRNDNNPQPPRVN
jgi:hypothetical protein